MINEACKAFEDPKTSKAQLRQHARFAVKAFSACMVRISADVPPSNYTINDDGGNTTNSLVLLCI